MGILIVRFEMPFNIWCLGCNAHIGKGVRYNAEKKQVGNYFSTKIWQFTMKCHLCNNKIVVTTDPKSTQYLITSGGRAKIETWEAADNGTIELPDAEQKEQLQDPLGRLEHAAADKHRAEKDVPVLTQLTQLNERMKDDYLISKAARRKFRTEKKAQAALSEEASAQGLQLSLLPPSEDDAIVAGMQEFNHRDAHGSRCLERLQVKSQSIFSSSRESSATQERHAALRSTLLRSLERGAQISFSSLPSSSVTFPPLPTPSASSCCSSTAATATLSNHRSEAGRKRKQDANSFSSKRARESPHHTTATSCSKPLVSYVSSDDET